MEDLAPIYQHRTDSGGVAAALIAVALIVLFIQWLEERKNKK